MLEFRQLRRHPKYKKLWDIFYANELGRLYQGVRAKSGAPTQKCVNATDACRIIKFYDVAPERQREMCHTSIVAKIRPDKESNRTRMAVAANGHIYYPDDLAACTYRRI